MNIVPDTTFETTRVTITNPDSGRFILAFVDHNFNTTQSDVMNVNTTAADMRSAIKNYYASKVGSDIIVTKTMFDAEGNVTTNSTNSTVH